MLRIRDKLKTMPNSQAILLEKFISQQEWLLSAHGTSVINLQIVPPQSPYKMNTKCFPKRSISRTKHIINTNAKFSKRVKNNKENKECVNSQISQQKCWSKQQKKLLANESEQQNDLEIKRFEKMVTFNGGFRNLSKYSRKFTKSWHSRAQSQDCIEHSKFNILGIKFDSPKRCEHFNSVFMKSGFITAENTLNLFKEFKIKNIQFNKNYQCQTIHTQGYKPQKQATPGQKQTSAKAKQLKMIKYTQQKQNHNLDLDLVKQLKMQKQLASVSKLQNRQLLQKHIKILSKSNVSVNRKQKQGNLVKKMKERPQSFNPLSFANFMIAKK